MCTKVKDAVVLKGPITAYKVVAITEEKEFVSPYMNWPWEPSPRTISDPSTDSVNAIRENVYWSMCQAGLAFHSFKNLEDALALARADKEIFPARLANLKMVVIRVVLDGFIFEGTTDGMGQEHKGKTAYISNKIKWEGRYTLNGKRWYTKKG